MSDPNRIQEILAFWFDAVDDNTLINKNVSPFKKWFLNDPQFDQEIRVQFQKDLEIAAQGKYAFWQDTPEGCLALILLFDQFSRNMYRNTPQAFANDFLALNLAKDMAKKGMDKKLSFIYRVFVYMPFMHAEDILMQELGVQYFGKLVEKSKERNRQNVHYFQYHLFYAQRHCDIIKRFGRFPHRNVILGRRSTAEELEFLGQTRSFSF